MVTGAIGVLMLAGALAGPSEEAMAARAKIDEEYHKELHAVEVRHLNRLAELAQGLPAAEAAPAFQEIFQGAISLGLIREAEPIAEAYLARSKPESPAYALAQVVNILAEAQKGDFEGSLKSLAAVHVPQASSLPTEGVVSLVDLYLQDALKAGRYDIARKALELVKEKSGRPAVDEHATNWLARIDQVGKPAPAIAGKDVDGRPVQLADFKGEAVLIVFWATWCSPCEDELALAMDAEETFAGKGLRILGVNMDLCAEGADMKGAHPQVERFLLERNISWPNLMCTSDAKDPAKAYGIEQLPANVLVGRDGKVIALDLGAENIHATIAKALGAGK